MNHPHESQAAAMARAGELPDGEQLRECINSGQVSAAQVVAHAENGEVMVTPYISQANFDKAFPVMTGWPAGMLQDDSKQLSKALSRDPNARALVREAVAHQEAGELPKPYWYANSTEGHELTWPDMYTADQMRAYATAALAAERAEVARLREALKHIHFAAMDITVERSALSFAAGDALTAPGEKHE